MFRITTYKGVLHCKVTLLARVPLNFRLEFETAEQPGFEPGSPKPKAAMPTIELHSIDLKVKTLRQADNYILFGQKKRLKVASLVKANPF